MPSVPSFFLTLKQRPSIYRAQKHPNRPFAQVIGGYGLFGVLVEVTLRVVPNVKIALESLNLDRHQFVDAYT